MERFSNFRWEKVFVEVFEVVVVEVEVVVVEVVVVEVVVVEVVVVEVVVVEVVVVEDVFEVVVVEVVFEVVVVGVEDFVVVVIKNLNSKCVSNLASFQLKKNLNFFGIEVFCISTSNEENQFGKDVEEHKDISQQNKCHKVYIPKQLPFFF